MSKRCIFKVEELVCPLHISEETKAIYLKTFLIFFPHLISGWDYPLSKFCTKENCVTELQGRESHLGVLIIHSLLMNYKPCIWLPSHFQDFFAV